MSKPMFVFGNGLSIGLSNDFSLRVITERFINELDEFDRQFFEQVCSSSGKNLDFDDFESNFTALESALLNLSRYNKFIESPTGINFINKYNIPNPNLHVHEIILSRIYTKYINMILDIIHGNVRKENIQRKLEKFCEFFISELTESEKSYVFTLNYDLLVETILLEYIGTEKFTDFCHPSGSDKNFDLPKYNFNPSRSNNIFTSQQNKIELHHLHGSLSLFQDLTNNKIFKLISNDIGNKNVYKRIFSENVPYIPAIITGGGKSDKINEFPFHYYYRRFKDVCEFNCATKLYIIGYSFRDEHINEQIHNWTNTVENYEKSILIIDFKNTEKEKDDFKKFVKSKIRKRKKLPDECFVFDGANGIREVDDAKPKEKKIK